MKDATKNQLIFGRHPVVDAISSGKDIDKVMLQRGTTGKIEIELRKLCKKHNILLQYSPKEKIEKFAKGRTIKGLSRFLPSFLTTNWRICYLCCLNEITHR